MRIYLFKAFLVLTTLLPSLALAGSVVETTIDGMIHGGTVTVLEKGFAKAKEINAEAFLIELDTPGGLLDSTRDIVKLMMNSEIPVIVYVGPSGARAGSAGTFITLAAHVAAMAPGTNIGAAHPVTATGQDPEKAGGKHLAKKVEEDTRAFIETIAKQRKRNIEWARKAVLESSSIDEGEALKLKVIDLVARDKKKLLEQIDGKTIQLKSGERKLATKNASLVKLDLDLLTQIKNWLANPGVMFILVLLVGMGFYIEMSNPGLIFPAAVAIVALVLLSIATSTLPVTIIGIGLMITGFALLIAEIYVTSFGLLATGGVVSFVTGAYLLFDPKEVGVRVPTEMIVASTLAIVTIALIIGYGLKGTFAQRQKAGKEALVGEEATVEQKIAPGNEGKIFMMGEFWNASADEEIEKGEKVRVVKTKGLKTHVEKIVAEKET